MSEEYQGATTTETNTSPQIRVRSVRAINCETKQEIPCSFVVSGDGVTVYYPVDFKAVNIWIDYE